MKRAIVSFIIFSFGFSNFSSAQSKREFLQYGDDAFDQMDYASAVYFYLKVLDKSTSEAKDITFPYDTKMWERPDVEEDTSKAINTAIPKDNSDTAAKGLTQNMLINIRSTYVVHQVAESYRLNREYENAELWYEKAAKNITDKFPYDKYYYGLCLMQNEKYQKAMSVFEGLTSEASNTTPDLFQKSARALSGCQFAIDSTDQSKSTQTVTELDSLFNSGSSNFAVNYFGDNDKLIFSSARVDSKITDTETQNPFFICDLYKINKNEDKWSAPENFGAPFNTDVNEAAGVLSIDKTMFFFTRWVGTDKKTAAIFLSRYMNGQWLQPMKLGPSVNVSRYSSMMPALSLDGTKLYYASDRPGGKGGYDIWYCTIDEYGNCGNTYNLGPKINTSGDEISPFYHNSTNTLFFSSNGHPGIGGFDILKANGPFEADRDTLWSSPKNIGKPINSSKDDKYFVMQSNQRKGYFTSDRKHCTSCNPPSGGYCDKIFTVEQNPLILSIRGTVYNADTSKGKKVLPNSLIIFKDVSGDIQPAYIISDENGNYSSPLVEDVDYYLKTQKNKYFADAATISTKDVKESKEFVQDFYLALIPSGEIVIEGIEYDYDKATLRPKSKAVLDELYNFLVLNNNIFIEINSNTDCRGSDEYNQKLSDARAKSCVDYLIGKGIVPERMMPKGYGETRPVEVKDANGDVVEVYTEALINSMKTKALQEAAHQKNRRTAFSVVKEGAIKPNK